MCLCLSVCLSRSSIEEWSGRFVGVVFSRMMISMVSGSGVYVCVFAILLSLK